jgi:UDP-sugar pyrophosphorylase
LDAGIDAVKAGNTAPGTMSSAESDKYIQNQRKLKHAGVDLPVTEVSEGLVAHGGIPVTPGPRIVLCPSFGITQEEIHGKIQGTGNKITQRSSLVLDGHQLFLKNLDLDGALVIQAADECRVTVDGLRVQNKGWELVDNDPDQVYDEAIAIRGYTMAKHETKEYVFDEPGNYIIGPDGEVKKLD